MIGYVLLIVFALIMGTIVYNVIKTYVPKNVLECPEDVSIFITDLIYTEDFQLNMTITNNGLFNIAGYFIRATNSLSQEIATKDLSEFLVAGSAKELNNIVIFNGEDNPMKPNDKQTQIFNLDENIYSIELIPVRFQKENKKNTFVSCGGSKIREVVKIQETECTDGETQLCPFNQGVCAGSEQTCIGGAWPGCDYSKITGYETIESSCSDSLDNDCDGNTDGADTDCLTSLIIFVSSTTYTGNLGGISGADTICNGLADEADLTGTFVAWLSDITTDAKDRITITDMPFKLVDDTIIIANDLADLIDGTIDNKINIDENGQTGIDAEVWTGTNEFGLKIIDKHCSNWISALHEVKGKKGKSKESDKKWTNEKDKECDNSLRIYCFQVS